MKTLDRILTVSILFAAKWLIMALLTILGGVMLFAGYKSLFTDGWGFSSLSKAEILFIGLSIFLLKRLIDRSVESGQAVALSLLRVLFYSGIVNSVVFILSGCFLILAIDNGALDKFIGIFNEIDIYTLDVSSQIFTLIVLYVSVPNSSEPGDKVRVTNAESDAPVLQEIVEAESSPESAKSVS